MHRSTGPNQGGTSIGSFAPVHPIRVRGRRSAMTGSRWGRCGCAAVTTSHPVSSRSAVPVSQWGPRRCPSSCPPCSRRASARWRRRTGRAGRDCPRVSGSARANGMADPRRVAFDLLRAVAADGAYANLTLPGLISAAGLDTRDAALATELGYGTLRAAGTLDDIVAACTDRAVADIEASVLDLLRLGGYQALRTRIPPHA